jgi:hypothetical protein
LFALASTKVSKSVSETRHSLPILNPRRRPFRSHCVTVRSFICRRLATSEGVRSVWGTMRSRIDSFTQFASISRSMEQKALRNYCRSRNLGDRLPTLWDLTIEEHWPLPQETHQGDGSKCTNDDRFSSLLNLRCSTTPTPLSRSPAMRAQPAETSGTLQSPI